MAITKLSITGNTTAVGISTTPVEIMLVKTKATGVPVTPNDNITTTNVQAALEQLDDIKAQATNGTLTNPTISGSASFGDNAKAKFGAGDDLQIYHDGSNSYIIDNGTGSLFMRGNSQIQLQDTNTADKFFVGTAGGAATLYFDNAQKIATTSTGIDVTGTATMDGLTVTGTLGNFAVNTEGALVTLSRPSTSYIRATDVAGSLAFDTGGSNRRMFLANNGDISFYEDTGTTPKLFWDASAESLGIGTSSPSQDLEILNGTTGSGIRLAATNTAYWDIERDSTSGHLTFTDDGAGTVLTVGQDGNVGIGTSSPSTALDVVGSYGTTPVKLLRHGNNGSVVTLGRNGVDAGVTLDYPASNTLGISTNGSEAMRINSSGKVGIGTSSPSSKLTVVGDIEQTTGDLKYTGAINWDIAHHGAGQNIVFSTTPSGGSATQRMRIDSSGNVGIGTTSPSTFNTSNGAGNLVVGSGSGAEGITVYSGTTSNGALCFADGTTSTDTYKGYVQYNHNTNSMQFATGHTERMRIDSSGNVIVNNNGSGNGVIKVNGASGNSQNLIFQRGGTEASRIGHSNSADLAFYTGSGVSERMRIDSSGNVLVGTTSVNVYNGTTTGAAITQSGLLLVGKQNDAPAYLNRIASDGNIIQLSKDGTIVGSIGTASGDLYIGTGSTKLRFDNANDAVYAGGGDGTGTDNNTDLGKSDERFKDLYLSGGVKGNNLTFSGNGSSEHARVDTSGNLMVGTTSQFTGGSGASTTVTVDGSVGRKGNRFNNFDDVWSSEDAVIIEGVSSFNPSNSPNAENWYFVKAVAINTGSQNIYCIQTATTLTGKIFTRYNNDAADSGTWTSWVEK